MKSELLMHEHQELDSPFRFLCEHASFPSGMLSSPAVARSVPASVKLPSRTIFRLLPTNPFSSQICLDTWVFVSLEVVGEFGRYQNGSDPINTFRLCEGQQVLPLECRLVGEDGLDESGFVLEKREVQSANWHDTESLSGLGIGPSGRGGFEIRIVRKNGWNSRQCVAASRKAVPKNVWIWISAETDHRIVPVVLGPATLSSTPWQLDLQECRVLRPFHIPSLGGRMKRALLLKEIWNNVPQGRVWDSAFGMVELFSRTVLDGINASTPPLFAGKRILDLSAGTGLLGLFVGGLAQMELESQQSSSQPALPWQSNFGATLSAPSWSSVALSHSIQPISDLVSPSSSSIPSTTVIMTDLPEALNLINYNIASNRHRIAPSVKLVAKQLRWGAAHLPGLGAGELDIVIASDVVYDRSSFKDLMETLYGLCTPGHTTIYLGCKRRRQYKDLEEEFLHTVRRIFRAVESVDDLGIHVLRLQR
ncbi:Methyltransferase-like protein 21A [Mortierella sp. GBA30]|nr:Methyltransferase-like protein 21A [Mortierella sp. GBA30]